MSVLELMSPAGSIKSFIAALDGGADSVYLGYKKFNARKPADNFDLYNLKKVINYAHSLNKKIYVTLNIDIKPNEISEVAQIINALIEIQADALIIKDLGILYIVNKFFKEQIEIHASTQMAISTSEGAIFCKKHNFKKVVLARELSLKEIESIKKNSSVEVEVFVEGSMCFSISGRCLMSSWVGGRSGNRGCCTAPCRLVWENNGEKRSFFSMKDLNLILKLNDLINIEVDSLKIEGRLKNPNWVYTITTIYRSALETVNNSKNKTDELIKLKEELKKYSAREISEGHLFNHKELIGENSEWLNYKKDQIINFSISEEEFQPRFLININIKQKITFSIKLDDNTFNFTFKKIEESKKGRNTNFYEITDYIKRLNYLSEIIITGEDFQCSANGLEKLFDNVKNELNLIYKKINELPHLKKEILEFVKFKPINFTRKKRLGELPNKIIINNDQTDFFLNNNKEFIEYLVLPIDSKLDFIKINKLENKYQIIFSIPSVIYEFDLPFYKESIDKLYKLGYRNFEVNSFTGINLLSNYDCNKFSGMGLTVLNHLASDFLSEKENFSTVFLSYESENETLLNLSKIIHSKTDILMFSKLSLFMARIEENFFSHGKIFNDKIGTSIETVRKDKIFNFVSNKYFLLYGKEILNKNIYTDLLTADLTNFSKLNLIFNKFLNNKFDKNEYSTFNFFEKLV